MATPTCLSTPRLEPHGKFRSTTRMHLSATHHPRTTIARIKASTARRSSAAPYKSPPLLPMPMLARLLQLYEVQCYLCTVLLSFLQGLSTSASKCWLRYNHGCLREALSHSPKTWPCRSNFKRPHPPGIFGAMISPKITQSQSH